MPNKHNRNINTSTNYLIQQSVKLVRNKNDNAIPNQRIN